MTGVSFSRPRRFYPGAAGTRLDREPHGRDRVSLGGGTLRASRRERGRIHPAEGQQRCRTAHDDAPAHRMDMGIRLLLRLAMIQTEPVMTRKTISTPKATARMLFVLSGPLPRCRKKTRWTPICAKASTTNPTGMRGAQSKLVCDTMNEAIVARTASPSPAVYDR